ncbi:hypothetical protein ACFSOZ_04285 [Mesorhizobium newzealandense]|uniref:DUF3800 domain-containing protein n=1 Tax=Mesorhizobium newzealandense TaxID=1300302 RepID=A0ABW4U4U6_9HYPH
MLSNSLAGVGLGDYSCFTDETDLTARYMTIGGITCGTAFVPELFSILTRYQARMPFHGRLQWKDITKRNHQIFEDLIDEFFYLNGEQLVDFHALVVDMWKFDHMTYNEGDKEVSFDKMLFQSLLAIHKRYPGCTKIRCFHGNRDSPYPIANLREMLNSKTFALKFGRIFVPYVVVKNLEVKRSLPMQFADLLIGALGAHWNRRKGATAGSPKDLVAQHFKRECPVDNLLESTPRAMKNFVVWEFKGKGLRA